MDNAILDLFNGNNIPIDKLNQTSNELKSLQKELARLDKIITENLSNDLIETYNQLVVLQSNLLAYTSEQRFEQGFKLGGKLAIKMLEKDN